MSDESNAAEVIQALVEELNRLKKAANLLEDAQIQFNSFKSENETRTLLVEKQTNTLRTLAEQLSDRQSINANNLDEIKVKSDRFEKWLKIEVENIHIKIIDIENNFSALQEGFISEIKALKRNKLGDNFIWITICWLSILTLLLGAIFCQNL